MNPIGAEIHLSWGGVFPCEPDWTWDTARTPLFDFDLWAVFAGRGAMQTPEGELQLARGDCLLLRPEERYVCRTDHAEPLLVHVIHFDYLTPPPSLPVLYRPLLDVGLFEVLTERAIAAHLDGHVQVANDWLRVTLYELDRQDRAQAPTDPRTRRIEQIRAEIVARPGHRWRIAELAASCHASPDHFTRLFRSMYGVTPREFVMRQRIDAARRLLLSSSHSVARIAELTGFSDIYHFSRQFKAKVGRSPTRFRRSASG